MAVAAGSQIVCIACLTQLKLLRVCLHDQDAKFLSQLGLRFHLYGFVNFIAGDIGNLITCIF